MADCDCNYSAGDLISPSGSVLDPSGVCNCIITGVRAHIGDLDDSPTYSDDRIIQLFNAASFMVCTELCSCAAVEKPTINICDNNCAIDLITYAPFISLVFLKVACMVDQGEARSSAKRQGLSAACGSAKLSVSSGGSAAYDTLFKWGACQAYKELKEDLCFRCPVQSGQFCAQILNSFTSWSLNGPCCSANGCGSGRCCR